MADLRFAITGASPVPYAATPLLALDVRIEAAEPVESLLLRTSVRIEAGARPTTPDEEARLKELFGAKEQWSRGSRSVLWTQVVNVVSAFSDASHVAITLPVSYDLAAVASKYLRALDGGGVPIRAQFGGTAFFRREQGLSAAPIALDREARFELPVQTFNEIVEQHFPDSAIITIKRELFDRLEAMRVERGLSSFDQALEALLSPRVSRPARTKRGLA